MRRSPLLLLPLAALLAAGGLLALATTAARALADRDRLVREALLLRVGHALEGELRASGPDGASEVLGSVLDREAGRVDGLSVEVGGRVVAEAGKLTSAAVAMPSALGPAWRELARGEGRGGGGGGGIGHPPFRLRLEPAPGLGGGGGAAARLLVGASGAALLLVLFAFLVARGLERDRRLADAEAEAARLEMVARAGAGLAHRIGSPLATIKGTAQLIEERPSSSPADRARRIVDAADRIEELVRQLLRFARPVSPEPVRLDLRELLAEAAAVPDGVEVSPPDRAVPVRGDRGQLLAVLEELVSNARNAGAKRVLATAGRDGGTAWLELVDDGAGLSIPAESAFEPYVTSRPDGTGLGLATVRSLARANGGELTLRPGPAGGAVARLELPAED